MPVHFLGAADGELEVTIALRLAVARLVRTVRPEVVLGHDPWRRSLLHPDHRAAGLLTVDGVVAARDPLYAPGLAAEGLAAHRPHTVLLFGTDAPDELVEVTATIAPSWPRCGRTPASSRPRRPRARRVRTWNAATAPTPACSTPRPSTPWTPAGARPSRVPGSAARAATNAAIPAGHPRTNRRMATATTAGSVRWARWAWPGG